LALNATVDGQTTAPYITDLIGHANVEGDAARSRVPVGSVRARLSRRGHARGSDPQQDGRVGGLVARMEPPGYCCLRRLRRKRRKIARGLLQPGEQTLIPGWRRLRRRAKNTAQPVVAAMKAGRGRQIGPSNRSECRH